MLMVLVFNLVNINVPYSNINQTTEFKEILNKSSNTFYGTVSTLSEQGSSNSTGGFWSGLTSFVTDSFLFKALNMIKSLIGAITNFYDLIAYSLGFIGVDPIIKYWIFGLLMIMALVVILRLISRSGSV